MNMNNCPYIKECNMPEIDQRDCRDYENCQSKKFYDRYGTEPLGIGACCDGGLFDRLMSEN